MVPGLESTQVTVAMRALEGIGRHDVAGRVAPALERPIGPAHFSQINFRGTMRFGVEKFAAALIQRASDQAVQATS